MDKKDIYKRKIEGKLEEWKAEADKLKAKAKQKQAETETEFKSEVDQVMQKRDYLVSRVKELNSAGGEAWKEIRQDIEKAGDEFKKTVKKAREKFQ